MPAFAVGSEAGARPVYSRHDVTDSDITWRYVILNGWSEAEDFHLKRAMAAHRVLDVGCGPGQLFHRARK